MPLAAKPSIDVLLATARVFLKERPGKVTSDEAGEHVALYCVVCKWLEHVGVEDENAVFHAAGDFSVKHEGCPGRPFPKDIVATCVREKWESGAKCILSVGDFEFFQRQVDAVTRVFPREPVYASLSVGITNPETREYHEVCGSPMVMDGEMVVGVPRKWGRA